MVLGGVPLEVLEGTVVQRSRKGGDGNVAVQEVKWGKLE